MKVKRFPNTGLRVSELCLGTMQFGWTVDEKDSHKILDRALELGIFFIDTADIYSKWAEESYPGKSEQIIGKWLKKIDREEVVVATKVKGEMSQNPNDEGLGFMHILKSIDGSLKRLQTDYVDLYQVHSYDPNVSQFETMKALNKVVEDGKAFYLGASNYQSWRLLEALMISEKYGFAKFISLQPKYNLINRLTYEIEMADLVKKYSLGIIPYSPQAAGFLTGKYEKGKELPPSKRANRIKEIYMNERGWSILEVVKEIAKEKDATPSQVALAWLLNKDEVVAPIIGANTVEQLEEAVGATEIKLDKNDVEKLNDVSAWKMVRYTH